MKIASPCSHAGASIYHVFWKYSTAERKQVPGVCGDVFLTQPVSDPTRGCALQDPLFTNRERL